MIFRHDARGAGARVRRLPRLWPPAPFDKPRSTGFTAPQCRSQVTSIVSIVIGCASFSAAFVSPRAPEARRQSRVSAPAARDSDCQAPFDAHRLLRLSMPISPAAPSSAHYPSISAMVSARRGSRRRRVTSGSGGRRATPMPRRELAQASSPGAIKSATSRASHAARAWGRAFHDSCRHQRRAPRVR